jgi:hypothetical protein
MWPGPLPGNPVSGSPSSGSRIPGAEIAKTGAHCFEKNPYESRIILTCAFTHPVPGKAVKMRI